METFFVRSWRAVAFRGLAALAFGLAALVWPSVTIASLVVVFGTYALADGVLTISGATHQRRPGHAWMLAFEGVVGVAAGLAAVLWTDATLVALVRLVALWALVTGAFEVGLAARLRRRLPAAKWLGAAGVASLGLGALMFAWPGATIAMLTLLLAGYALLFGTVMLALALLLRRIERPNAEPETSVRHARPV
jgi:uncharacterized membrane protein HdeD (DUF308 family)